MKKSILLTAAIIALSTGAEAAMNQGVQDVLDSQSQDEMLNSLNQHWYNLGLYNPGDLITSIMTPAADTSGTPGQAFQNLGDLLNHSIALDNWETGSINQLNERLGALSKKIEDEAEKTKEGIATSNAFSGLDNHLDSGKSFSFGIGAGSYESKTGFAVGGIVRIGGYSALNFGAGASNGGSASFKGGLNMQF
jgi:hypothetical protein